MQENSVFVILKIYTDNLYITLDLLKCFRGPPSKKKFEKET